MKTYVPFLRGKQNEMMALRELAANIAESRNVLPLIEPVKGNATNADINRQVRRGFNAVHIYL